MIFILISISSGLEFWSLNHTLTYESSESKVFKNIKFLDEISNNWPNVLLGINTCKTDCMLLCHVLVSEWIYTLELPECQGTSSSKQARHLKFKRQQRDSNPQPLSS